MYTEDEEYCNSINFAEHGAICYNFIGDALKMSPAEKNLSFLNNYFIFKKIRNVNAKTLNENIFEKMVDGNRISRILNQISMIFTPLGGDGGLFVFIGKKLM